MFSGNFYGIRNTDYGGSYLRNTEYGIRITGGADTVKETRSNIKKAKEDEEKKKCSFANHHDFLVFFIVF